MGAGAALLALVWILQSAGVAGVGYGLSHSAIAANGVAAARIRIPKSALPENMTGVRARAEHGLIRLAEERESSGDLMITLISGYQPGEETISVEGLRDGSKTYRLRLFAVPIDLNGNGLPDAAELRSATDVQRFRSWFCAIAESQFYKIWDAWIPEQRDCAGLVRFAMREGLKKHDDAWFARAGRLLLRSGMPDVAAFQYPDIPFLGTDLFRVRRPSGGIGEDGSYFARGDFSSFATARFLMDYNAVYLGRDLAIMEEGDLLFFEQDDLDAADRDETMHIMIFLGRRDGEDMLVYHTGDPKTGSVRKLSIQTLAQHPDARWHPASSNRNFLGVYRLAIIA
jgi:uncharacterized protein YfaT (DUF1175 family)